MKRRGLITFLLLSLFVFIGLALYGDLPELLRQVSEFPIIYWFIALGLASVNYLVRLVRWQYYLRLLNIRIDTKVSAAIFLSGLSMTVSPGRLGELAKSYFLKEKMDVPVAVSSSAVVAERVTDMIAVLLLSLWGLTLIPYGWAVALVVLTGFGSFILLMKTSWGRVTLLKLPLPGRWRPFMDTSTESFRQVFSFRPLILAILLGMAAWLAEGLALWVVLRGLDTPISLGQAVSIYSAATLLGAVTMLPGGLVGTEGGMVALLQQVDLDKTPASTATFVIRICTLWFAVLIGLLALAYVQLRIPKRAVQEPLALNTDAPGQPG